MNKARSDRWTPLTLAINTRSYNIAKNLVDSGANVNGRWSNKQFTPLMEAAANVNYDMVQFLLDRNADPNAKTIKGFTAMHHVNGFSDGQIDEKVRIIDALKARGADVNPGAGCVQGGCIRPMHYAAWKGCWRCVDALKASGAPVDWKDGSNGDTPLHWAAGAVQGHTVEDYVRTLDALKAGRDSSLLNIQNHRGWTPLSVIDMRARGEHFAKVYGVDGFVNTLKAAGGAFPPMKYSGGKR